jgi:hypothetical protein
MNLKNSLFGRRRLWLPLLACFFLALACGLALFRRIGVGELALIAVPILLVIVVEGGLYVAKQFFKGYRNV